MIHPSRQNPEDYLTFEDEFIKSINNNSYGETTIKLFKLDDDSMDERRREILEDLRISVDVIYLAKKKQDDMELQQLAEKAQIRLQSKIKNSSLFAGMTRAFLRKNYIDF